jgi:predicted permease
MRALMAQPSFSIASVAMLAAGIGATTAVFSVVNGVLVKPLSYPDSHRLVRIVHVIGGIEQAYFNDAIHAAYADNTRAFEDLGVWSPGTTAIVDGQDGPQEVRALSASRGVLTTLGVHPELGRSFSTADDTPGAADTVILSHGYWQRRFGADPAILHRAIAIDARPHLIIGVMPKGFRFDGEPDIVLPLRIDRGNMIPAFRLLGVGRMKPGVTLDQANADAARVLDVWFENRRADRAARTRWVASLRSLKQQVVGDVSGTLWVLMGTMAIVLLVACANVANLQLVRADARRRELAVRAALGASRMRLVRQLLVESLVLAVCGGALGVGVAHVGLGMLVATGPSSLPRLTDVSLDSLAVGFALTISLGSGLLFGLLPSLAVCRPRFVDALGGGRSGTLTRERQRSQQALVASQVALALVLLVAAGLMIRSVDAMRRVDPGFAQPQHVQTFSMAIPATLVPDPERVTRMQQDVLDQLAGISGVASAAFLTRLPMGGNRESAALAVAGQADDGQTPPNRQVKLISPGMFQTLGTPLVAGRDFTWADLYDTRDVAIVSENLAREVWGSATAALGKRVREYYVPGSVWREVVGVAGDVHDDGVDQITPGTIYWPAQPHGQFYGLAGHQARRVSVAIRTRHVPTEGLLEQVRRAVWSVSAALPLAEVSTLDALYERSMARAAFTTTLLAIAGAMALLLGVSGLYGVIAYAVSQRRREIGIRLALGAQAREIRGLFLRRGLVVVGAGMAIGLVAAASLSRFMQSLLFGISSRDPMTFIGVPIVLAGAAMLASYLPARRAAAVDPNETLRAE